MQIHNAKLINRTNNNNTHTYTLTRSKRARERQIRNDSAAANRLSSDDLASSWDANADAAHLHTRRVASLCFYFLADADVGAVVAARKR